jgi:hypothetical protein
MCHDKVFEFMFFFVLGFFNIRNQAIGTTNTIVDIIEICDAYFTV